jgi:putative intracellular protease/amidase|tara:strand:+ start:10989 stop:11339 length:351 start_codon:yes stop_codon:yes gene_type:complete
MQIRTIGRAGRGRAILDANGFDILEPVGVRGVLRENKLVRVREVPGGVVIRAQLAFVIGAEQQRGGVAFGETKDADNSHADHEREVRQEENNIRALAVLVHLLVCPGGVTVVGARG